MPQLLQPMKGTIMKKIRKGTEFLSNKKKESYTVLSEAVNKDTSESDDVSVIYYLSSNPKKLFVREKKGFLKRFTLVEEGEEYSELKCSKCGCIVGTPGDSCHECGYGYVDEEDDSNFKDPDAKRIDPGFAIDAAEYKNSDR